MLILLMTPILLLSWMILRKIEEKIEEKNQYYSINIKEKKKLKKAEIKSTKTLVVA